MCKEGVEVGVELEKDNFSEMAVINVSNHVEEKPQHLPNVLTLKVLREFVSCNKK